MAQRANVTYSCRIISVLRKECKTHGIEEKLDLVPPSMLLERSPAVTGVRRAVDLEADYELQRWECAPGNRFIRCFAACDERLSQWWRPFGVTARVSLL